MRLFIISGDGVCAEAPPAPHVRDARVVYVGDEIVTVALPPEVGRAIEDAGAVAFNALRVRLAPFGLHPYDIAAPTYERVLYRHEVRA